MLRLYPPTDEEGSRFAPDMLGSLDLSFFSWDVIGPFVAKGLWFSVWLTIVATLGGIAFGTVLALMRLSGKLALELPAAAYVNTMRSVPSSPHAST